MEGVARGFGSLRGFSLLADAVLALGVAAPVGRVHRSDLRDTRPLRWTVRA